MSDWCEDEPITTSSAKYTYDYKSNNDESDFSYGSENSKQYNNQRTNYKRSDNVDWRHDKPRFQHQDRRGNFRRNDDNWFSNNSRNYDHSQSHRYNSRGRRGGYNSRQRGSWKRSDEDTSDWHHFSSNNEGKEEECGATSDNSNQGLIDWDQIEKATEVLEKEMFSDLAPVKKNTYQELLKIQSLSPTQVQKIRREKNSITVSMLEEIPLERPFNPVKDFSDAFHCYPSILKLLDKQGFKEPSPIQSQLWPILMTGYDSIGIAQTGTGKTLAYLLPGLLHIEIQESFKSRKRIGPLMLVLAPTRELAQQIEKEVSKFNYKNMKSVCVYGQGSRNDQRRALERMVEIVIATPGRLIDFVDSNIVDLREVSYLVLDEADRMLDLGFQPDIIKVTSSIRRDRQTVLTSATWPFTVEYIAKRLMQNPVKVQVGDLDLAAVSTVTQIVEVCEEAEKTEKLLEKLDDLQPMDKIIIFTNRKATVNYLVGILLESNIDSRAMHGGLEQCDRESALEDLKLGQCQIMIATDVASRGLDITDLTMVINLDLPKNLEEYVHRSGRTGRAGKSGVVISFVTWDNKQNAEELIKILERSDQFVPSELRKLAERGRRYLERRQEQRRSERF